MTQYERIQSGKATAEQIAAEIKTAANKVQLNYKRIPGHVLVEEFLVPYFPASLSDLSNRSGIPYKRLTALVRGQDRIDLEMASRLSSFFGKPTAYFLDIQERYERGETL